jgi:hypothetical protein
MLCRRQISVWFFGVKLSSHGVIVNRALSLYDFIDAAQAAGDDILLRRRNSANLEVIRLI